MASVINNCHISWQLDLWKNIVFNNYLSFLGQRTRVFIFLLNNGAWEEINSRELLFSELNGKFEDNFYFGKNHWRIIFFLKNIKVVARTHATTETENYLCTGKCALLFTITMYQISLKYVQRF